MINAEELFRYAKSYVVRNGGTRYPTFREAAKHFRCRLNDIELACEDYMGSGYMKPAVAIASGGGVGAIENKGDWLVEAYD